MREGGLEEARPAGDPQGGAQAELAEFVAPRAKIGHGGLSKTNELSRGFRRVDQGGKWKG